MGALFVIIAIVASNFVREGIYPISSVVTMWGAIICALQCFLMVDQRAHEYHDRLLATRQAKTRVLP